MSCTGTSPQKQDQHEPAVENRAAAQSGCWQGTAVRLPVNSRKRVAQILTLFAVGARLGILQLMNAPLFLDAGELAPGQRAALQAYFATPRFAAGIKAELAAWQQLT